MPVVLTLGRCGQAFDTLDFDWSWFALVMPVMMMQMLQMLLLLLLMMMMM